jgi:hypothetical protein
VLKKAQDFDLAWVEYELSYLRFCGERQERDEERRLLSDARPAHRRDFVRQGLLPDSPEDAKLCFRSAALTSLDATYENAEWAVKLAYAALPVAKRANFVRWLRVAADVARELNLADEIATFRRAQDAYVPPAEARRVERKVAVTTAATAALEDLLA